MQLIKQWKVITLLAPLLEHLKQSKFSQWSHPDIPSHTYMCMTGTQEQIHAKKCNSLSRVFTPCCFQFYRGEKKWLQSSFDYFAQQTLFRLFFNECGIIWQRLANTNLHLCICLQLPVCALPSKNSHESTNRALPCCLRKIPPQRFIFNFYIKATLCHGIPRNSHNHAHKASLSQHSAVDLLHKLCVKPTGILLNLHILHI